VDKRECTPTIRHQVLAGTAWQQGRRGFDDLADGRIDDGRNALLATSTNQD
jgi:hypothetical protein